MKLSEIPQRTNITQCYRVDIGFDYLELWLKHFSHERFECLDLNPDFQRGHVWTTEQRSAFVEFLLSGGETTPIMWNIIGGMENSPPEKLTIVDGLQRLTSVRMFLAGDLRAFGCFIEEFEDAQDDKWARWLRRHTLRMWVNKLPTRAAVLKWYLEINAGGTPHSRKEIDRVRGLLENELRQPVSES